MFLLRYTRVKTRQGILCTKSWRRKLTTALYLITWATKPATSNFPLTFLAAIKSGKAAMEGGTAWLRPRILVNGPWEEWEQWLILVNQHQHGQDSGEWRETMETVVTAQCAHGPKTSHRRTLRNTGEYCGRNTVVVIVLFSVSSKAAVSYQTIVRLVDLLPTLWQIWSLGLVLV